MAQKNDDKQMKKISTGPHMMKNTVAVRNIMCIALLASILSFSAAHAQQAESRDISRIGDTLVPVGEHNNYHYSHKIWNISANPMGVIWGSHGVSVSHAGNANIAIRADITFFEAVDEDDDSGVELSLSAPIHFRKVYSGFFVEPGLVYSRLNSGSTNDSVDIIGPQVLLGWHWIWDSGWNLAIAGGGGRNFASVSDEFDEYEDIFPNGYIRVGYAF